MKSSPLLKQPKNSFSKSLPSRPTSIMKTKSNSSINDAIDVMQTILDSSTESMVLVSLDFKVLYFNEKLRQNLYDYFKKDLIVDADYRDFVVPEVLQTFLRAFQKALNHECVEIEIEAKNEINSTWFLYIFNPVYDKQKQMIGVTLIAKDIDAFKKSQFALKEQSDLLSSILQNNPDGLIVLDKDYQVIRFNTAADESLNLHLKKRLAIGIDFKQFLTPDIKKPFCEMFMSACAGNIKRNEYEGFRSDKSQFWANAIMYPVYSTENKIFGVSILIQKIDDRKRAEIELRKNEQKFRKIIETASNPILIASPDLSIQLVNPEVKRLFGYDDYELVNQHLQQLIPNSGALPNIKNNDLLFEENQTIRIGTDTVVEAKKKDGNSVIIEASFNMFQLEGEKYVLIIVQDISHRIQSENFLKKANRELGLLNGINDIILSHDLKANLSQKVCDTIVKESHYQLAWIAKMPEEENTQKVVRSIAASGQLDYLNSIMISLLDAKHSLGPTITTIKKGEITVINNLSESLIFKPWFKRASKYGLASSISIPICIEDDHFAALNIYSDHINAFDKTEISILQRVGENLSLALKQDRVQFEKDQIMHDLNERVKELRTIYQVGAIMHDYELDFNAILAKIVEIIPLGWQYPKICSAKITFDDKVSVSSNYIESTYRQSSKFVTYDKKEGEIEIVYLVEKPELYEGPFLEEERNLIDTLAEMVGSEYNKRSIFEQLKQSQYNLLTIFDNTDVGYLLLGKDFEIISFNKPFNEKYSKAAGIHVEVGMNLGVMLKRQHKAKTMAKLNEVILKKQSVTYETKYRIGKQSTTYLLTIIPIKDNQDLIIGVCLSAQDITLRKEEEIALIEQQQKLFDIVKLNTQVIQTADQCFYVAVINLKDPDNMILTFLSPQIEKILGCNISDIMGLKGGWRTFVHPDDLASIDSAIKKIIATKNPVTIKYRIHFKQSLEYRWVEDYIWPLLDTSSNIIELYGSIRDIDNQEQTTKKLKEERENAYAFQSKLLSSQLNPHFIYNTLNAFQYTILKGNLEDSLTQIADFSKLLRRVLENSMSRFISLRDEIEFLNQYVNISKLRIQKDLSFEIIIDNCIDLDDTFIPPMLLQPYLENAIIHGFASSTRQAKLTIWFSMEKDYIRCSILDNGVGRFGTKLPEQEHLLNKSHAMSINKARINILNQISVGIFSVQVFDHIDKEKKSLGTEVVVRYKIFDHK